MSEKPEDPSVSLFREYVKIESVQPNPDYDGCIKFLSAQAEILDFPYQVCDYFYSCFTVFLYPSIVQRCLPYTRFRTTNT